MLLSVASFLIAVVSLLVTIVAFMVGDKPLPRLRLTIGVSFLLITILFSLLGLFSFVGNNFSSLSPFLDGNDTGATIEDLGLKSGNASMPEPASAGQVIVAHGDIDNSGTCHIKEFGPGVPVQGLGSGTFRLVRITGTAGQIAAAEAKIQQAAAADAGGSCPWK